MSSLAPAAPATARGVTEHSEVIAGLNAYEARKATRWLTGLGHLSPASVVSVAALTRAAVHDPRQPDAQPVRP